MMKNNMLRVLMKKCFFQNKILCLRKNFQKMKDNDKHLNDLILNKYNKINNVRCLSKNIGDETHFFISD